MTRINTAFLRSLISRKLVGLFIFMTLFGLNAFSNEPQGANHGEEHAVEAPHSEGEHAEGEHSEEEHEGFDAGHMIMHHVLDAHEWHIMDIGDHAISIPLPIIIYDKEKGLTMFLSSKFKHGHAAYEGYIIENEKIYLESEKHLPVEERASVLDFSITKNVTGIFVSAILLLWIFLSIAKSYKKREGKSPKGMQSLIEPIIIFVRDELAKPSIGKGYEKFMPFLLSVFFFIWINNLLGLVPIAPGGANVTGSIGVTMVLAVFTFVITHAVAKKAYWKHIFLPPVPPALWIILIPVEIMGMFIKPFVLMVRLFANITAGHIIALGFMSLIFIFGETSFGGGIGAGIFSTAFTVFMTLLELLVAFIQAYVFTFLSALYFGTAIEEDHH